MNMSKKKKVEKESFGKNLHASEDEAVLIGLVVGCYVIVVQDPDFEYAVVCAKAYISDSQNRGKLKRIKML